MDLKGKFQVRVTMDGTRKTKIRKYSYRYDAIRAARKAALEQGANVVLYSEQTKRNIDFDFREKL